MRYELIRNAPFKVRFKFYLTVVALSLVAIFTLAFIEVTLRKIFDTKDTWETIKYFSAYIIAVSVAYRLLGLNGR